MSAHSQDCCFTWYLTLNLLRIRKTVTIVFKFFFLKMPKLFSPFSSLKIKHTSLYSEDEELKGKELEREHLMERERRYTMYFLAYHFRQGCQITSLVMATLHLPFGQFEPRAQLKANTVIVIAVVIVSEESLPYSFSVRPVARVKGILTISRV